MGGQEGTGGVRIRAPAKVNLILRVLDRRPDGFHNLWSLMHSVALEDALHLQVRPDFRGIRLECSDPSLPTDQSNLIARAATLLLQEARQSIGLRIQVIKRIPMGGGLGGGSSDAAATLVGLNRLLRLGWSPERLGQLGQAVGSDIPFFLFAPSAIVRGRGEEVTPFQVEGQRWILLTHPGFPIGTKWAYDQLVQSRREVRPLSGDLQKVQEMGTLRWDDLIPMMENDFEEALAVTHGVFHEIKQELLAHGAEAALLSGSGSVVFGVFRSESDANFAQEAFLSKRESWTSVVRTSTTPLACHDEGSSTPPQ